jgi:hypothetical protein
VRSGCIDTCNKERLTRVRNGASSHACGTRIGSHVSTGRDGRSRRRPSMTGHRRDGSSRTGHGGLCTDMYELQMVESDVR